MKPCHLVKPVSATRVSGRYLTHQNGLPSLPVPPLQQTCERYISALEPIIEAEELKHTKELVDEFQKAGGVGERLQRGLEKRASNSENWVSSTAGLGIGVQPTTTLKGSEVVPSVVLLILLTVCGSVCVVVRVVGTGCLPRVPLACGCSFKSRVGLAPHELPG